MKERLLRRYKENHNMEAAVSSIVLILFIFQRIIIPEEAGWAHYTKENGKKNQNLIAPDLEEESTLHSLSLSLRSASICARETARGSANTVHVTDSAQGGIVSDPLYLFIGGRVIFSDLNL